MANFEYLLQRLDTINDLISAQIEVKLDASAAAVQAFFDGFLALPSDPADDPGRGGLFRVGDTNGYYLVRIYPKS